MKLSKQCQRVLSLLLAILFLATSMPSSVYASEISVSPEAAYTETVDEADTQEAEVADNATEESSKTKIQEAQPEAAEQADVSAGAVDTPAEDDAEVKTEKDTTEVKTEKDTTDGADDGEQEIEFNLEKIVFGQQPKFVNIPKNYSFSKDIKKYDISYTDVYAWGAQVMMGKMSGDMYCEVYDGGTSFKKLKLKEGANTIPILPSHQPKVGNTKTITIKFGTKDSLNTEFTAVYDTYTYIWHRIPGLTEFTITDSEKNALEVMPKFDKASQNTDYTMTVADLQSEIQLSATPANAATKVYVGETEVGTKLDGYTVVPDTFEKTESGEAVIPIKLVYDDTKGAYAENTYTLKVSGKDYRPVITEQPRETVVEKNTNQELSVTVAPPEEGTLSYQWLKGSIVHHDSDFIPVKNANESTYTPDTTTAGTWYYKCKITNTVNGTAYVTESQSVPYTVKLTYVNDLTIRYQPGTCAETKTGFKEDHEYKSEYYVGEHLERICYALNRPEPGTEYSTTWYYNTEDSTDLSTAVQLNAVPFGSQWMTAGEPYYRSFDIADILPEGTYYIFNVTKATDTTDTEKFNSITSQTVKVTVNPINLDSLEGEGTESSPFLLKTTEDLPAPAEMGQYRGTFF